MDVTGRDGGENKSEAEKSTEWGTRGHGEPPGVIRVENEFAVVANGFDPGGGWSDGWMWPGGGEPDGVEGEPPPKPPTLILPPPRLVRGSESWTDDPFLYISLPFAHYLEPDGFAAVQAMASPIGKTYARLMPQTYALARLMRDSLPQTQVWGKHLKGESRARDERGMSLADVSWATVMAGKWIHGQGKTFPQRAMGVMDMLNMLAHPDHHAIGNQDAHGGPHAWVRHVRIDIDMDVTFDHERRDDLRGEVALCHDVFAAFGLTCQVLKTGNRGIQVIACIPEMDRATASVFTELIRVVLRDGRGTRLWRVTDFQTSLEGLMRLPFGRHAWTGSLAVFLDFRDASILPVEDQVAAAQDALTVPATLDMIPARDLSAWLAVREERSRPVAAVLPLLVRENPDNALIVAFRRACDRFGVPGWSTCSSRPVPATGELETHTNSCVFNQNDVRRKSAGSGEERPSRPEPGNMWMRSAHGLKRIAWSILNAGFAGGESFLYYTNKTVGGVRGANAVGWALVAFDGDRGRAKGWLDEQAERTPARREADIQDRKRYIAWAVAENDTYERFRRRADIPKHRFLGGDILAAETDVAQTVTSLLPALRRASRCRTKIFQTKALEVLGHVVELAQMTVRQSEDGLARMSCGTMAAEVERRWPESATSKGALARHLEWIVAGTPICIFEALEVVHPPVRAMDPTTYRLGRDLVALVAEKHRDQYV